MTYPKPIEADKLPEEVKKSLRIQNVRGWTKNNRVKWTPKGNKSWLDTNVAIIVHQLENGSYVILDRYNF
ncbi:MULTISPECIES: hypothetical protein [unclassified Exiguobacterium]|uniref:hypothetical protein n=1 Tax=unclassified Exiguobacterium TaxID=2644629 RepID=UPI001BE52DB0|nr:MULTISPECIES: hypothetical protein [unclassified Exiguobacterium]